MPRTTATENENLPATPDTGAPEAPASEPTVPTQDLKYPVGSAPEEFDIEATVELRGDGSAQTAYNVRIVDVEAMHILDSLGAEFGAQVKNATTGDYWLAVKATAGVRTKLKQAKSFSVLLKGRVRINKAVNGQLRGELFAITTAVPATLRNGGRMIERQAREREDIEGAVTVASQAGGRGGMRSLLNSLR